MPAKHASIFKLNPARLGEICRRPARGAGLLCAVLLATLTGCSRSPTEIVVDNRSNTTLSNVWISTDHFAQSVGTMIPGESVHITVAHPGKSRAALSFQAGGKKINVDGAQSFGLDSGHPLLLTVGKDLNVSASGATNGH